MRKKPLYNAEDISPSVVQEVADLSFGIEGPAGGRAMVRTQIYLTVAEHEFIQTEAQRTNGTMASVIRGLIDEKMRIPESVWEQNSLLEETPRDEAWNGPSDLSRNLDHYLYGLPKVDFAPADLQKL